MPHLRAKRAEIFFWFVPSIVTEHLSEARADILALHRFNLYPFIIVLYKYIHLLSYFITFTYSVVRGAPLLVGALSTCLVCLWVNPALADICIYLLLTLTWRVDVKGSDVPSLRSLLVAEERMRSSECFPHWLETGKACVHKTAPITSSWNHVPSLHSISSPCRPILLSEKNLVGWW